MKVLLAKVFVINVIHLFTNQTSLRRYDVILPHFL
jgi:hypothetical protein